MDTDVKSTLLQSYNANAKLRDKPEIEGWKLNELNRFISFFDDTQGLKLLDLGAGAGQHGQYLQSNGFDVHCVDLSPEMVKACRNKGLNAEVMDFYSLKFEEDSFDAAWSLNALLHVPKSSLHIVLNNIKTVLKPGALFYLGLYGGYDSEGIWEEDPYTPKRFFSFHNNENIQVKAKQYFELVDFEAVPTTGTKLGFQSLVLRKRGQQ
ncbi:class I SAM-dependent methyltransferase [Paenibacillus alkalitolerans]|uniref:class I SAM-dependent methyltransferase n=1 Tax=Paenibacillus alkalitolerans TaxID=2799335 RepID=UPI0018F7B41C|nr:class I SAM-dependent methyltransferase [Paenibacillus alkalitolerans]